MIIRRERYQDICDEIRPVLIDHWIEIARNKFSVRLDPDWAAYQRLEDDGKLRVLVAREAGVIAGYTSVILAPGLHYKSTLYATLDLIWLKPEQRRGTLGYRLLKMAVEDSRMAGARVMHIHHKLAYDLTPLVRRLGGEPIELIHEILL